MEWKARVLITALLVWWTLVGIFCIDSMMGGAAMKEAPGVLLGVSVGASVGGENLLHFIARRDSLVGNRVRRTILADICVIVVYVMTFIVLVGTILIAGRS